MKTSQPGTSGSRKNGHRLPSSWLHHYYWLILLFYECVLNSYFLSQFSIPFHANSVFFLIFQKHIKRLLFGILFIYVSLYFWVDFVKSLSILYDFSDSTWVLLIFKYLIALSLLVYSTALYQPWGFYRLILGYSGAIFCLTFMCVLKYEGLTTTNL